MTYAETLTEAEGRELFRQMRESPDPKHSPARERLILCYRGIARKTAQRYARTFGLYTARYDDVFQEVDLLLIQAIDKCDPGRIVKTTIKCHLVTRLWKDIRDHYDKCGRKLGRLKLASDLIQKEDPATYLAWTSHSIKHFDDKEAADFYLGQVRQSAERKALIYYFGLCGESARTHKEIKALTGRGSAQFAINRALDDLRRRYSDV